MKMLWFWCVVVAAWSSCDGGSEGTAGRVSLDLTGQFFPGELTSLDIFIYDGEETTCQDNGSLSTEPTASIDSQSSISLENPEEISFTLRPNESYVVYARAGQRDDSGPLDVIAQGCTAIELEYQAEIQLFLQRLDTCGDENLDFQEMCDDGNLEPGDGCDADCATEAGWVNDTEGFQDDRQYLPIAAGDSGLLAVCWQSDALASRQSPMAWFDPDGGDGDPFRETAGDSRRDCAGLDVDGNNVLMSYSIGSGGLETRANLVTFFEGREQVEPVIVGEREDRYLLSAITDDTITTVALNAGQLVMRSVSLEMGVLTVDPTDYEVAPRDTFKMAPALTAGRGGFVVVWGDEDEEIWARFFTSVDEAEEPQPLCRAFSGCSFPVVAGMRADVSNPYFVVYRGANDYIVGRFLDMSGQPSDEFEISTAGDCMEPTVAPLSSDEHEFIVAWTQSVGSVNHVFARIVSGVDEFGAIATGRAIAEEPIQVTPPDGPGYDQPQVATAYGTSDPTTALVFYRDIHGKNEESDDSDSDIGIRLLRVTRQPDGS